MDDDEIEVLEGVAEDEGLVVGATEEDEEDVVDGATGVDDEDGTIDEEDEVGVADEDVGGTAVDDAGGSDDVDDGAAVEEGGSDEDDDSEDAETDDEMDVDAGVDDTDWDAEVVGVCDGDETEDVVCDADEVVWRVVDGVGRVEVGSLSVTEDADVDTEEEDDERDEEVDDGVVSGVVEVVRVVSVSLFAVEEDEEGVFCETVGEGDWSLLVSKGIVTRGRRRNAFASQYRVLLLRSHGEVRR